MKNSMKLFLAAGILSLGVGASSVYAADAVQNNDANAVQGDTTAQQNQAKAPQFGHGHGGHFMKPLGGPGLFSDEFLTFLNLTQDELRTQLDAGKTLKEIAGAKGITEDKLKAFLVEQETKKLEEMKAELPNMVDKMINQDMQHPAKGEFKGKFKGKFIQDGQPTDGKQTTDGATTTAPAQS
ncbi:MAG TPA: hypothetical protein VFV52_15865 [Bacilli bacterium]|nr:hypothetical protein [Bacilli bacterium]